MYNGLTKNVVSSQTLILERMDFSLAKMRYSHKGVIKSRNQEKDNHCSQTKKKIDWTTRERERKRESECVCVCVNLGYMRCKLLLDPIWLHGLVRMKWVVVAESLES